MLFPTPLHSLWLSVPPLTQLPALFWLSHVRGAASSTEPQWKRSPRDGSREWPFQHGAGIRRMTLLYQFGSHVLAALVLAKPVLVPLHLQYEMGLG